MNKLWTFGTGVDRPWVAACYYAAAPFAAAAATRVAHAVYAPSDRAEVASLAAGCSSLAVIAAWGGWRRPSLPMAAVGGAIFATALTAFVILRGLFEDAGGIEAEISAAVVWTVSFLVGGVSGGIGAAARDALRPVRLDERAESYSDAPSPASGAASRSTSGSR